MIVTFDKFGVTQEILGGTVFLTSIGQDLTQTDLLRLLDRGCNAVFVADAASGEFIFVNDKGGEMTGYEPEELFGAHVSEIVHRIGVNGLRPYPS